VARLDEQTRGAPCQLPRGGGARGKSVVPRAPAPPSAGRVLHPSARHPALRVLRHPLSHHPPALPARAVPGPADQRQGVTAGGVGRACRWRGRRRRPPAVTRWSRAGDSTCGGVAQHLPAFAGGVSEWQSQADPGCHRHLRSRNPVPAVLRSDALGRDVCDAGQAVWATAATASSAVQAAVFWLLIALGAALAYSIAHAANHQVTSGLNDLSWVLMLLSLYPTTMLVISGSFGLWQAKIISGRLPRSLAWPRWCSPCSTP